MSGRISRGHPSFNEVNFFYPPYRCVTIRLSFQNPGTPMARINRREVLADDEVQVVHCINRCVRRGFLCGDDSVTG